MARKNQTDSNLAAKGFLAASALGALNTANAIKPAARKGPVSVLSFFPGWLTSELPLHVIGWQALATAGFVRAGALRSPKGWAALGLSAASWTALYKTWLQSLEAGDIYAKALRDGLGDDLVTEALPTPESDPKLVRRRIAAGPLQNWRKRYVSPGDRDLSYGEAGRRNQLDIWKSPDIKPGSKAPVLVQVHGGGWIIGNKQQQAMPMLAHLADQGWVCVSINYRLSPRATWPDHIVDVKRALAWVKTNIAEYGGDPDFVCITGGSAGGHLSSLAALTPNEPMFQPGFEDADTSVAAAVPFYGVYDWTNRDGSGRSDMDDVLGPLVLKVTQQEDPELWYNASTMSWVSPDAPPFFVIHGANDSLVPVEQARSFVAMLRAESKEPVAYAELPGAQHGFEIFDSPRTLATVTAVHRFLESVRRSTDHSGINSKATP
ncbi:MAG: alpha/beta hydrolase [Acidimicrobiales bacterium]|nr:alpha/beta hydrolase [Acidimicrobiales bacterium]